MVPIVKIDPAEVQFEKIDVARPPCAKTAGFIVPSALEKPLVYTEGLTLGVCRILQRI